MAALNISDSVLSTIISRLVEAVQPERLILFGSRAAGAPKPHSDHDLLIIKSTCATFLAAEPR